MSRVAFIAVAVALLLGLVFTPSADTAMTWFEAAESHDDHCCPDEPEEADCCDVDLACCATGVVAALGATADPTPSDAEAGAVPSIRALAPQHLWLPQDNGPPPLPPPIG